jgi:SAM-dependent methyltransferase
MSEALINDLVCPVSGDPLRAVAAASAPMSALACEGCGRTWPVRNGIPRLVPPGLEDSQRRTAVAFGWQWTHFREMHDEFESQFLDWLHPIEPSFFKGKRVLDAGCGTGRHAFLAASYGAAEVVALDLSAAVDTAQRTLRGLENVHVVQGDLLHPPMRTAAAGGGFDIVYSIGVLHHLPDPYEGFRSLLRFVRPGGTIAIWVYGHENNGAVRNVVEPMRRISTRLPPTVLRAVAWPLALGFNAVAKGIYRPLSNTSLGSHLPLDEYMTSVADFSFRQNYGIVVDQLNAPLATYLKGDEVRAWFDQNGLDTARITHRHGNSWRAQATVPS